MTRETAIKSVHNRRVETPETRRLMDFEVGDIVQIKSDGGKAAGKMGMVIGIRLFEYQKDGEPDLAYRIKLSDTESIEVSAGRMRFLSHKGVIPLDPATEDEQTTKV